MSYLEKIVTNRYPRPELIFLIYKESLPIIKKKKDLTSQEKSGERKRTGKEIQMAFKHVK